MVRVLKTPASELDIYRIWDYIAADNLAAADRLLYRFEKLFVLLSKNPEMGERQDQHRTGLRSFTEGSYVVYYESDETGIIVYRILHSARRVEGLLGQDE
ncbi:MAG: type II toxin-antitoxin system RelE/ParE family toxin [Planctomycetes bacterium]|nr:type II toxin-antitoxin system RelE/ParE family toxin [Planctomycetota bacterium]